MSHWLDKYRNYHLEVFYLSDANYHDRGVLTDFGDTWLELRRPGASNELFLVPVSAVRRITVLRPPDDSSHRLLRAAEQANDE